jgi:TctA family transporter
MSGMSGLLVAVAGTAIGLIPPLLGTRRMNCFGVILLPIACNLSNIGGRVAAWLGLI